MNEFIGAGAVMFIGLAVGYAGALAIGAFEDMLRQEMRRPQLLLPPPNRKKEKR